MTATDTGTLNAVIKRLMVMLLPSDGGAFTCISARQAWQVWSPIQVPVSQTLPDLRFHPEAASISGLETSVQCYLQHSLIPQYKKHVPCHEMLSHRCFHTTYNVSTPFPLSEHLYSFAANPADQQSNPTCQHYATSRYHLVSPVFTYIKVTGISKLKGFLQASDCPLPSVYTKTTESPYM